MPTPAVHLAVWTVVYAFWLVVTRDNQPTWAVAAIATFILVAGSAFAVYTDWYMLRPRLAARRRWLGYMLALVAVIAALTFATVPMIQIVYDLADIPKEVRFGFWTNVGYETAWYAVHLVVAACVRAAMGLRKR